LSPAAMIGYRYGVNVDGIHKNLPVMKSILLLTVFFLTASFVHGQSDSALFYFQKGIEEKNASRFREAEKRFAKAHELSPDHTPSLIELAAALLEQNRYAEAYQRFLEAEKKEKENPIVIGNLAALSFNLRKWDEAIRYAQKGLQLKIDKPFHYIIGKSYYEQEDHGKAIPALELAFREEPQRAEIPYTIGRAYLDMGNNKQSVVYLERAIALDSSKTNWIYECGLAYSVVPDHKKSLQFIELAGSKGYKKSNDYMENLGNAYLNAGVFEKGIAILGELIKKKPSDAELIYQAAQACYQNGKYREAIGYWDQALELDNTNARALYMIGLSYQKMGEKQKGQQLCDRAIQMDPSLQSLRQQQGGFM